jgi:hypothetical protein
MKKRNILFLLVSILIVPLLSLGQIPPNISHQGFIADSLGHPVTGIVPIGLSLYDSNGAKVWSQYFPSVNVMNGIYNIEMAVDTIDWSQPYTLEISINGIPTSPRVKLTSVPYAFTALSLPCKDCDIKDPLSKGVGERVIIEGLRSLGVGKDLYLEGDNNFVMGSDGHVLRGTYCGIEYGNCSVQTSFPPPEMIWMQEGSDGVFGCEEFDVIGSHNTIPGGEKQYICGHYSIVAGGYNNKICGNFSFAGGMNAYCPHSNSFIWSSATDAIMQTTKSKQFVVRADSGVILRCDTVKIQSVLTGETMIELATGLDYAEGFDVTDKDNINPGDVLIIDADNPGKLTKSGKPYDPKVAGIVSGANNLGSGVKLGSGRYDLDVALAGRVYCNVDANEVGIEPGDLLTTSDTPGYAMKVVDSDKAKGAILGKAMERLEKGKSGQIMVLVTLQ